MMEFGKTLREAREAKGLSISQIAEQTHMMSSIIQGLENEDFTKIVAPIYGRGFVKLYCEAVGIEPMPLIAEFMELFSGSRIPGIRERGTSSHSRRSAPPAPPPPPPQPEDDFYGEPPQTAPEPEPTYAAPIPEPAHSPSYAAPIPEPAPEPTFAEPMHALSPEPTYAAPIPEAAPEPTYATPIPEPEEPTYAPPPPPAYAPQPRRTFAPPRQPQPQPTYAPPYGSYDPQPSYTPAPEPPKPPSPDYDAMFANSRGRIVQPELNGLPPSRQPVSAPKEAAPIDAPEPPPPRPGVSSRKQKLTRYGSPLHDIHTLKPTLPSIDFPPNLWRIALLVVVVLGLLCGMVFGIRVLYRMTTDHTPIPGMGTAAVKVTPSEAVKTAKPTAVRETGKTSKSLPPPTGRVPQQIPSLYID